MSLDIGCKDTIAALSSGQGHAALAIVRASGPRATKIFHQIFRKHRGFIKNFMAMHGQVLNALEQPIDDVMAILFTRGLSFTGEESFEIHCHGNPLIVEQILSAIVALGGRLAEPGEFSLRAMLNGKIDLAQAESIADLIHAQSEAAREVALKGVQGGLLKKCAPMRETIIRVLAEIEARMDFPDEELGSFERLALIKELGEASKRLDALLENAALALKLHDGVRLVICGLPNAGKSTLLNRLIKEDRAIVHESAGTTRDVIEARLVLEGMPVVVVDVAGIRNMDDASAIEQIGINKAMTELSKAHVVIWLADCTVREPFGDALIKEKLQGLSAPILKVLNKRELLNGKNPPCDAVLISAALDQGIEELKKKLADLIGRPSHEEIFITRARQRDELILAQEALKEGREALHIGMVDEVITSELRTAGLAFDRLFGTTLSEDVLDRIFSEFCIGK